MSLDSLGFCCVPTQVSPNTCLISCPTLPVPPRSSPKSREQSMPDGSLSISLPLFPVFHPRTHFNTRGLPCLPTGFSVFSFHCPARARNHGYPQLIP
ncbi:hypothetical protein CTAM01_16389 [Colletotrichum tamarilloi]|uniref:Uncharacterized protein n=1 Tax=Colletotrichum tamarilloi TaxID=1209934 RepID=A0ABQ9QIN4_9PEZI|nr:uncharacterized protein CTAM01_16389 [Colletotrichum tamarilloi]KAK1472346.1 hypothetical protein CTAM01_16389 [Colletotrichum tamarilloi]